jgi:hypothetical protein
MWVLEQENPLDDICEDKNTYEFFNMHKAINTSTYIILQFSNKLSK